MYIAPNLKDLRILLRTYYSFLHLHLIHTDIPTYTPYLFTNTFLICPRPHCPLVKKTNFSSSLNVTHTYITHSSRQTQQVSAVMLLQ